MNKDWFDEHVIVMMPNSDKKKEKELKTALKKAMEKGKGK